MRENRHRRPLLIKCLSAGGLKLNILPSEKKCIILKVTACITPLSSTAESDKQHVSGAQPGRAHRLHQALLRFFIYSLLKRDDVEKEQQAKELEQQASNLHSFLSYLHAYFIQLGFYSLLSRNPLLNL